MMDDDAKAEGVETEPNALRKSGLHSMDSWLWESSRGAPPFYVLIGIWVLSGFTALTAGAFTGFLLFGALLWIGIALGAVSRYESGWTPHIVLFFVCGAISGIFASIPFLKPAVKATRLYHLASSLDDDEEDINLPHKQVKQKKRRDGP